MAKAKKSAAARMKDDGKSLVWATFTAREKSAIQAAAGISGVSMAQLVRASALTAAEKILDKFRKST